MSFEKVVKLACKPKAAPPKDKYLDPIIAATYSTDGAIADVCSALSPRLREPNAVVVYKALIVLHTMIRSGQTENVLGYLASSDPLRLGSISNGHWEGYDAPDFLANYAGYLETRIKAYKELKHDAIRVQTESNRDNRVTAAEGDSRSNRRKTIIGRKLRSMSVEKGLLRETRIVLSQIDPLVATKIYVGRNLEDELNLIALRMLVKDLLVLFQAVNEGIINLLENYFEMSKIDAKDALDLYRKFCKQTERVVEYLSVAKKLQNLLNVPIPNLKHAPVSLVRSLEEYLNDPNFEANRVEYKSNKAAADGRPASKESAPKPSTPAASTSAQSTSTAKPASEPKSVQDFFASIEAEQTSMFDPNTGSPSSAYFQQNAMANPFMQQQSMLLAQATGMPFQMQGAPPAFGPTGAFVQPQQTGMPFAAPFPFLAPQMTAAPFLQPQQTAAPFIAPQATATPFGSQMNAFQPQPTGMLQPQATGSNPFRQSMLLPQNTGWQGQFGVLPGPQASQTLPNINNAHNPFPRPGSAAPFVGSMRSGPLSPVAESPVSQPFGQSPFIPQTSGTNGGQPSGAFQIARPSSTPITSLSPQSAPGTTLNSLAAQPTSSKPSRNPFGQPVLPAPESPAPPPAPTLQQLITGAGWNSTSTPPPSAPGNTTTFSQPPPLPSQNGFSSQPTGSLNAIQTHKTGNGLIGSVASEFAFGGSTKPDAAPSSPFASSAAPFNSAGSPIANFGAPSPSFQSTNTGSMFGQKLTPTASGPSSPLQPQPTGFGGSSVKPFKPTSSFGTSLAENLGSTLPSSSSPSTTSFGERTNVNPALLPNMPAFTGSFSGINLSSTNPVSPASNSSNAPGTPNPFRMSTIPPFGQSNLQGQQQTSNQPSTGNQQSASNWPGLF